MPKIITQNRGLEKNDLFDIMICTNFLYYIDNVTVLLKNVKY